jgi:hypothetical protein
VAKWTIGSYNRFIGSARKARTGLSVAEARSVYRQMKEHLGKNIFAGDIARHPVIFKRLAKDQQLQEAERTVQSFTRRQREKILDEEMQAPGFWDQDDQDEGEEWELGGKADYKKKS